MHGKCDCHNSISQDGTLYFGLSSLCDMIMPCHCVETIQSDLERSQARLVGRAQLAACICSRLQGPIQSCGSHSLCLSSVQGHALSHPVTAQLAPTIHRPCSGPCPSAYGLCPSTTLKNKGVDIANYLLTGTPVLLTVINTSISLHYPNDSFSSLPIASVSFLNTTATQNGLSP